MLFVFWIGGWFLYNVVFVSFCCKTAWISYMYTYIPSLLSLLTPPPNPPLCVFTGQSILKEIGPGCSLEGLMLKLKLQYFGHLMRRADSFEKTLMLGKMGMTEDEMVGWHHRLNGHGFGWTPGVGDGQGGLACCSAWGCKESDTTEWLNWIDPGRKGKHGYW